MRMLLIVGLMAGAASLATLPAMAQRPIPQSSTTIGPVVSRGGPVMNRPASRSTWVRSWGHRVNGRWWGGVQAPGGWSGYRRPGIGYVLPGYWLQPGYHITDYGAYGLPAPSVGYGWSRYYDDAVLTDRYGKVYDSRVDYDWDRYGGYDDGPGYAQDERRDNSGRVIGSAVIGGVAGGLLGSAIAGPGSRTGGAIIGAGVGAIAGAAVADATAGRDTRAYAPGYDYDAPRARPLTRSEEKLAREALKQRRKLDTLARKAGYQDYDAYLDAQAPRAYALPTADLPAPGVQAHWAVTGGPEESAYGSRTAPQVETRQLPGYVAGGYYYPGATITTITIDPVVAGSPRTGISSR
jgi:Ni/Co efflux regulator RcnB